MFLTCCLKEIIKQNDVCVQGLRPITIWIFAKAMYQMCVLHAMYTWQIYLQTKDCQNLKWMIFFMVLPSFFILLKKIIINKNSKKNMATDDMKEETDLEDWMSDESFWRDNVIPESVLRGQPTTDILRPHPTGRNRLNEASVTSSLRYDLERFLPTRDLANLGLTSRTSLLTTQNTRSARCLTNTEQGKLCVQGLFIANPFNDRRLCGAFCSQNRRLTIRNIVNFLANNFLRVEYALKRDVLVWSKKRAQMGIGHIALPKKKSSRKKSSSRRKPSLRKNDTHRPVTHNANFIAKAFVSGFFTATRTNLLDEAWEFGDGARRVMVPEGETVGSIFSRTKNLMEGADFDLVAEYDVQFDPRKGYPSIIGNDYVVVRASVEGHGIVPLRVQFFGPYSVRIKFQI